MTMQTFKVAAALIALLIAFGIVGAFDSIEEDRQIAHYCEMVELWKQSNGREGWPAYKGQTNECK